MFDGKPPAGLVFHNQHVTAKDTLRYGEEVVANAFVGIEAKQIFVHDTLHYYHPDILAKIFAGNPKVRTVLYTIVVPPEI